MILRRFPRRLGVPFALLMLRALLQHLLFTLRLNFRTKMPIIYGYLVPILFLIGFAAILPASREMGQILTITVLGGACFGMPTALVSERERGIWRRYRLLPMATAALITSTMIARLVLVGSAAILQIILAMCLFHLPMPSHPLQLAIAFLFVTWAFLGMGLVIAMLADSVAAVQALGQAIFLPMILIGGVGVPLDVLPRWARAVADFMPGRYAVEALSASINGGLWQSTFDLVALVVIGAAACATGASIFRWDESRKLSRKQKYVSVAALLAWIAIGIAAETTGQSAVVTDAPPAYQAITQAQIDSITYDDLQDDNSFVTPVVWSLDDLSPEIQHWTRDFGVKLANWAPANDADLVQRTRNLLAVAAIADLDEYPREGEVPYAVFGQLKAEIPQDQLIKILAYVILQPNGGTVPTSTAGLGIPDAQEQSAVRSRSAQYAKKLLGRLLGKLG
jgi:ABC-type multidrug transport system permease subunit